MASLCSLELFPSHLQRAQLHTGVVLGRSRAGRGWEGSDDSAADFRAQHLGAGSGSPMDSRVVHGDRPECGRRCEPGCSTQHVAPSTQHAAPSTLMSHRPFQNLVSPESPAEALMPSGGGAAGFTPGAVSQLSAPCSAAKASASS